MLFVDCFLNYDFFLMVFLIDCGYEFRRKIERECRLMIINLAGDIVYW